MGRSVIPKYKLEIKDSGGRINTFVWNGKPTAKRLEDYVKVFAKSHEPGGVNEHISKGLGYVPYPISARILLNKVPTGRLITEQIHETVVTEWVAPAFMAW